VTHTVQDAEAAISRHPEALMQLSMAADLLIELDDPRGADFAACLAGDITGEEVMRRHQADVSAMYVAAWRMAADHEECPKCEEYNGVGQVPVDVNGYLGRMTTCPRCDGVGSNGNAARAEALRLLAECGKVGKEGCGYSAVDRLGSSCNVPQQWFGAAIRPLWGNDLFADNITNRLDLLDTYAHADPDTRRRWAKETRALTVHPTETTP